MSKRELLIPGKYYHIYNRGNNREILFRSDDNYLFFLQRYAHYMSAVVATYAYCLMPNHFHFLIRVLTEEEQWVYHQRCHLEEKVTPLNASKQFRLLFTSYAMAFNNRFDRTGGLFERPFKRKPVENAHYLAYLVTYIHHNPQKHGFVDDFREWKWSSFHAIGTSGKTRVAREDVIDWFDGRDGFEIAHRLDVDDVLLEPVMIEDW